MINWDNQDIDKNEKNCMGNLQLHWGVNGKKNEIF